MEQSPPYCICRTLCILPMHHKVVTYRLLLHFQHSPPGSPTAPVICPLRLRKGSSFHGIFQARILSGLPFPSPGIFLTQESDPATLALQILYHLRHQGHIQFLYHLPLQLHGFCLIPPFTFTAGLILRLLMTNAKDHNGWNPTYFLLHSTAWKCKYW